MRLLSHRYLNYYYYYYYYCSLRRSWASARRRERLALLAPRQIMGLELRLEFPALLQYRLEHLVVLDDIASLPLGKQLHGVPAREAADLLSSHGFCANLQSPCR